MGLMAIKARPTSETSARTVGAINSDCFMVQSRTGATIMLIASSLLALGIGLAAVAIIAAVAIGLLWVTSWAEEIFERFRG